MPLAPEHSEQSKLGGGGGGGGSHWSQTMPAPPPPKKKKKKKKTFVSSERSGATGTYSVHIFPTFCTPPPQSNMILSFCAKVNGRYSYMYIPANWKRNYNIGGQIR